MKTLSIANQKGGVGKSTETVHLAYAALEAGLRVLLVDMDVQGNSSMMFEAPESMEAGLVASELFTAELSEVQPQHVTDKLSVIRADLGLLDVDKAGEPVIAYPSKALRQYSKDYDLCLIDCPPLLGIRLMGALTASDYVLTPVQVDKFTLNGVADLMQTIQVIRTQGFNPRLRHMGWLPSRINGKSKKEKEALENLRAMYGAAILPHMLMERAAVKTAIENNIPVWEKVRGSSHEKAAKEWRDACQYILGEVL